MTKRECPNCEEVTMVENNPKEWECLNCGSIYDTKFLDEMED